MLGNSNLVSQYLSDIQLLPVVEGHTHTTAHLLVVIAVDLQFLSVLVTSIPGEPRPLLNFITPIYGMFLMISIMHIHTLVTQIVFALWTEVLGFSVKTIFLTLGTTIVMNEVRPFVNRRTSSRHFYSNIVMLLFI